MAETTTANYGWTMPDPGASANTWGATLNATTQKVDAQVFVNQTAINAGQAPIGGGALWFTATPPAGWLICDGSSLATTGTYAGLFAVIGYAYGGSGANFNLPNLNNRFAMGGGTLAATGGEASHVLTAAEIPAHAHPITDVAHSHTASQPAHVHPDPGHTHAASQPAHNHTYNMPNVGSSGLSAGGAFAGVVNFGTGNAQPPITVNAALTGLQAAGADAITVTASGTGLSTTNNTGGGASHNNLPPYLAINFIIRYA